MSSLDIRYLNHTINKAKRLDSVAFSELFAATFTNYYKELWQKGYSAEVEDILYPAYRQIMEELPNFPNYSSFSARLTELITENCSKYTPLSEPTHPTPPDSEKESALLNKLLNEAKFPTLKVPLHTLKKWANYQKPGSKNIYLFLVLSLIILLCFPIFFIPPIIRVSKSIEKETFHAKYTLQISHLLPISTIHVSFDGKEIPLRKIDREHYDCDINKNGSLSIYVSLKNGQRTKKTVEIAHLDTKPPVYLRYSYKNELLYLYLQDTYSGIDYQSIKGLRLIDYNEDLNLLRFEVPKKRTTLSISDHAGNSLKLTVFPPDTN